MAVIDLMREKGIYQVINNEVIPMGDFSHSDSEPIWRQNGYQLRFDSDSNDYARLNNVTYTNINNFSDVSFKITFSVTANGTEQSVYSFGSLNTVGEDGVYLRVLSNGFLAIQVSQNGVIMDGWNTSSVITSFNGTIELENLILKVDGVTVKTFSDFSITSLNTTNLKPTIGRISSSNNSFLNGLIKYLQIQGETFDFKESTGNTIEGSLGTVATINTSDSGGTEYIDEFVWEKKSFSLVGNGSTQKIVFDDLSEIILTSSPLVGGFTQSGEIYSLTEGLGTKIYSNTGLEATIQGFTIQDLNFGGWLKGDDTNGWNPYTI